VEALKSTSHLLVKFGGHKQAAGLTLKTENVEVFYQNLLEYAESINYEATEPSLDVDAELFENSINLETADIVASLEPFGAGNTKPIFVINDVSVVSSKAVGKESQHLQLNLCLGQTFFSCIAFNFGYLAARLSNSDIIDVVVEFLIDEWNGNRRLKFRIIDIKLHE
jgi:single-stranded-DNA-specific exonuclease